jgi:hypothetical protein|tara:strand:- start:410 stop:709 length:300 start_codon:yes stop_codon:yes gene_type:complete
MISSKGLEKLGFDKRVDFVLQNDGDGTYIRDWNSNKQKPTTADIEAAHAEWQSEYDAQEYARKRLAEYPTIEECVHAILDDGLVELQEKRAAVKARFPK